jgi:two-component system sensor histidine kinase HydH
MFETTTNKNLKPLTVILGVLSLITLIGTAWVLSNVRREQAIVTSLISHLQGADLTVARELSSDLSLQRSLSGLLILNTLAAAVAFTIVLRGYFSSERTLQDVKVLSTDILASMDAGVITTDLGGRIISINPRGRELVGLGLEQPLCNVNELDREHDLLPRICTELRVNTKPIRDRDYQITRKGHRMTLRAGCTMLRNRQKEQIGMVIHVRDVTEKALMEERLRRMERYVGLGSLAAGLQHEIKNPLNALSLHIQLLGERLQKESYDREMAETMEILNTEIRRIGNVLDGFRSYASIHELGRNPVNVTELIQKLIRLLRPDTEQKQIKIEWGQGATIKAMVLADAAKLEQVFLNLALNAVAAMPEGGVLGFSIVQEDEKVRIDISDTGSGIPAEIQSQIFDPYFTTKHEGLGMGLAICEKIVRQHDGTIEFQTSPNGTTFSILLPADKAS